MTWCRICGFEPAAHHRLIIEELEKAVLEFRSGHSVNLMVLTPPGSGKSTYTSKLFIPWFLAQAPNLSILSCSHSADLAQTFGRVARNYAEDNARWLGYSLKRDSRAVDEWGTTNGGQFYCNGVGAGLSGRRADCFLVDDFCGKEEDVNSKAFNDKIWDWWVNDVIPRFKPPCFRVVIANHRNEDDLCGRLMKKEAAKWRVIRLRLLIENEEQSEDDPLHRAPGEHLWPEYFTKDLVTERMSNPRASGIEQQEPSPEAGAFFTRDQLLDYTPEDLQKLEATGYRTYAASDHAVSEKQTADLTCLIVSAYANGLLYILPETTWDRLSSKKAVEAMLTIARKRRPLYWWAEKGHISKSIGPFLQDRMHETKNFFTVTEVTPVKDKMTRAQTAHGMASSGIIRFPNWLTWSQRAKRELLMFPNGKHDDFVDALSLLCMGVKDMVGTTPRKLPVDEKLNVAWTPTMKWLKDSDKRKKHNLRILQRDL